MEVIMKGIFKLFGIIVLVAIIGFSMVTCDDGGGGEGGGGNGNGSNQQEEYPNINITPIGNTLTINDVQVYKQHSNNGEYYYEEYTKSGIVELTHLQYIDYNAYSNFLNGINDYNNIYKTCLISEAINSNPSVKIMNGKLSVNLGTPKSGFLTLMSNYYHYLNNWSNLYEGVIDGFDGSVSPSDAKFFTLYNFNNIDEYENVIISLTKSSGGYVYVDKDVTISIVINKNSYKISYKKGWNKLEIEDEGTTDKWVIDEALGIISGTITLTDVPNPAPNVQLSVSGNDYYSGSYWNGNTYLTLSGSGTQTVNWSIPIRGDNFSPSNGSFSLNVTTSDSDRFSFQISATNPINISSANTSGINLGTVSLKTLTLKGTINVTYKGQLVPYVYITAYIYPNAGGSVSLNLPSAGTSWQITMPASTSDSPEEVTIGVLGLGLGESESYSFIKGDVIPTSGTVMVSKNDTEKTGIVLDLGNITE